jgi:hypothetical protein
MFQSQKNVFWQALLFTILLIGIGILLGVLLESWRTSSIDKLYQQSDVDLLDVKLQTDFYSAGLFNCKNAEKENLNFADRVYNEAKILDRYEQVSELTDSISKQHKKYDILRANLLYNSIRIKQKCNSTYYDVVYLYKYNDPSIDLKAKQNIFSKLLGQLKEQKGYQILLIPMAGDNNVTSISLIEDLYNVSEKDLPVIVINGKKKITNLETFDQLIKNFK